MPRLEQKKLTAMDLARDEFDLAMKSYKNQGPYSNMMDNDDDLSERFKDFVRPNYWSSLVKSVEIKNSRLREYRKSTAGAR